MFLLLILSSFSFGQTQTDVPTTGLLSPVVGDIRYQSSNIIGSTTWAFNQHKTLGHSVGGGINNANDTYAWDCNLYNDVDYVKNVYPVADGVIADIYGWAGSSYGQLKNLYPFSVS